MSEHTDDTESTETPDTPQTDTTNEQPAKPDTDWQAEAEKWKKFARTHEEAKKANKAEADRLKAEFEQFKASAQSEKESVQLSIASERAVDKLHMRLARAGMDEETATALLGVIDSSKLLAEGKPNDEAIETAAQAIVRNHGTVTPDPDLGQRDTGNPKKNMDDIIRAAARR